MDKENNNSNSYMDQKEYNDRMIKMMIESGQYCEKCECHIVHCTCKNNKVLKGER